MALRPVRYIPVHLLFMYFLYFPCWCKFWLYVFMYFMYCMCLWFLWTHVVGPSGHVNIYIYVYILYISYIIYMYHICIYIIYLCLHLCVYIHIIYVVCRPPSARRPCCEEADFGGLSSDWCCGTCCIIGICLCVHMCTYIHIYIWPCFIWPVRRKGDIRWPGSMGSP